MIAEGTPGVERLVAVEIPAAMAARLALSDLAAAGASGVIALSGAGAGSCRIGIVLHADGARYTLALRPSRGALPRGLAQGIEGLDAGPPEIAPGDTAAREWIEGAAATLTRTAGQLLDDHRFWGDLASLIMLADLVE